MFELRVLTGLHQGAALPLFGEQWSIGASVDADLALYDPDICERHVRLLCHAGCWSVQAEQGLLQDDAGQPQAQIPDLGTNRLFSLAQVRLYVAAADQPWPQLPRPVIAPGFEATNEPPAPALPTLRHKRVLGICAVLVLCIVALGLTPSKESQPQASLRPVLEQKKPLSSAYEVRQRLLKMLAERELAQRFALDVVNDQITIDGTGSKDELALISRMLDRFREQFDTSVPVISQVRERNTQLPFKIVQIVGGKNGHVVLEDGRRLFLGDEVDALRLTAIDNDKVVFDGQQRYEVGW